MSQLKRWCFTSMSCTPSFSGCFSSCAQNSPSHGQEPPWNHTGRFFSPDCTTALLANPMPGTNQAIYSPLS